MGQVICHSISHDRTGGVEKVVEHLLHKCEALSPNPIPQEKKKNNFT
jgi:hypothetical protein